MNKLVIKAIPILFVILGVSCSRRNSGHEFTIQGQFKNTHSEKVVFGEMDVREFIPLDSTTIDADGMFSFVFPADQAGFYFLKFPEGRRIILLMDKQEHLFLKGNILEKPESFSISGSKGTELLHSFFKATARNRAMIDSVKEVLLRHEGEEDFLRISMTADSAFSSISVKQKKLEKDFIDQNTRSLASLVVLYYSFGLEPVLSMESDFGYYLKLGELAKLYPLNKHVMYHIERMKLHQEKQTTR